MTIHEKMNRAWMRIPCRDRRRAAMSCPRCGGTGTDPEYDLGPSFFYETGPCTDCEGYAFDRFNVDLRRMRLLGLA